MPRIPNLVSGLVRWSILLAILIAGQASAADHLDLPPRPADSRSGSAFANSVAALPYADRERLIVDEILKGNVPSWSRELVPVTVGEGPTRLTLQVASDYLAVGSDDDYFYTPLSPAAAQRVADRLGCTLPTSKLVDAIYEAATVKLAPSPIPPSPAMTSVPVFLEHSRTILAQRHGEKLGALVAGHKKDVVISRKAFASPGKVAIYGWHREPGKPIQPLYAGHADAWVDYSHGIRLIQRTVNLDGKSRTIQEILADPKLAGFVSDEGVMNQSRYPTASLLPEGAETLRLDRGVRVVIDRPTRMPPDRPILLVFYALPNGSTIEQTVGKVPRPGDDWHFDIQQIAAQTRFLREVITDRSVVVAYLENDQRSWPSWRKTNGDAAIAPILEAVEARFDADRTRIVLSGHSGGGSLIFGYLNSLETIPDTIERIAFLDANYAYETERHRDKLAAWLKSSDRHFLCVLAYNDAAALLEGKQFVTEAGGTWGRSRLMRGDLAPIFPFTESTQVHLTRATALTGRVAFFLTENPERKILHTVQVEKNGFIEAILSGTASDGQGYVYMGDRAYSRFIREE